MHYQCNLSVYEIKNPQDENEGANDAEKGASQKNDNHLFVEWNYKDSWVRIYRSSMLPWEEEHIEFKKWWLWLTWIDTNPAKGPPRDRATWGTHRVFVTSPISQRTSLEIKLPPSTSWDRIQFVWWVRLWLRRFPARPSHRFTFVSVRSNPSSCALCRVYQKPYYLCPVQHCVSVAGFGPSGVA